MPRNFLVKPLDISKLPKLSWIHGKTPKVTLNQQNFINKCVSDWRIAQTKEAKRKALFDIQFARAETKATTPDNFTDDEVANSLAWLIDNDYNLF